MSARVPAPPRASEVPPTTDPPQPVAGPREASRHGLVGPFTGRQLAVAAAVVGIVAVGLVAAMMPIAAPSPSLAPVDPRPTQYAIGDAMEGLAVGDRPPELAVPGPSGSPVPATTLDGHRASLAGLRGKVVWVDFWASWCPPCRAETPVLRDLYARDRERGLELIAVSVQESTADDVRGYAATYGLTYPIVADLTGSIFREWRVYGLPTQFLLDRDGIIRAVVQGPVDAATARALVEPLLGPPGSPTASTPPLATPEEQGPPSPSGP
jgi:cytochrome c biogenesis protein CcmG/thiol:disulfide interchange protein DsbE